MNLKKLIILLLFILVIVLPYNDLLAQNVPVKPTRQSSFEAFSKGNYEQAYNEFSDLLLTYSKDPLYKYYSGVCLVKLNKDPDRALSLLQESLQGAATVKTLPSDAMFYIARAQQMSGKFTEAIVSFNMYIDEIGKKKAREQGVPEFIQQCNEKRGKLIIAEVQTAGIVKNETVADNKANNIPAVLETQVQKDNDEVSAKMSLPSDYERILDEALNFQFKADSINNLTGDQRRELEKLSADQKPALQAKISENEMLVASFQKSADLKYSEAQTAMNPLQDKSRQIETPQPSDKIIIIDTVKQLESPNIEKVNNQSDTPIKVAPAVNKTVETFSFFEILGRPVTDPNERITIDPEVPEGLIYRIQIAVFRNPVSPSYFKGITPVYGFKVSGTDKTNYYAGMFRRSADARKALSSVQSKGFKDAFVVALADNKRVSADRAAVMEKEWGKKPFIDMTKSIIESPIDTVPPTLSFRVELVRSVKPIKDDVVEGYEKLAGNRGFDILPLENGNFVFLIGKFITFESAAEYADLLVRNGYKDAKVVAWLGKKEIPVDTARKLFESLE